jgi:hypothetical protein
MTQEQACPRTARLVIHSPYHKQLQIYTVLVAFAQVHTRVLDRVKWKGRFRAQTQKRKGNRKGKKEKWGNLLDRANMHDKARRREWRCKRKGLVCVVCRRYKIAVASWASEHDRTGAGAGVAGWMYGEYMTTMEAPKMTEIGKYAGFKRRKMGF